MKKLYSLSKEYINVNGSYGGSQNFFREDKGFFNKGKVAGGCGLIAVTDVTSYLLGQTFFESRTEYKKLFNRNILSGLWLPLKSGITFIHELLVLKALFLFKRIPCSCSWKFSRKKLYPRIREMLKNDIPVILCIPRVLGRKNAKNDRLVFYNEKLEKAESTNGHFVTVTGIWEHTETSKLFLEISSWGIRYFISYEEYVVFLKKHLMGLLGNIMMIKRKDISKNKAGLN